MTSHILREIQRALCEKPPILLTFDDFICFEPPVVNYRRLAKDMLEAMEVSKKSRLS
ncbi:hypothetical protein [Scytonema sp. NUACC26]|uniref:hypothetical protein n=1 Tax=Scytonema sp. NUACC26 TaxID=3140176 RepID=UPI0034DC88D8